ncbi:MAG: glycoside hydrolase family 88 protein [Opitutaceae bacterium]|nr:glycoside hydrolase family 88 protein [Opitutaceae bacterium]
MTQRPIIPVLSIVLALVTGARASDTPAAASTPQIMRRVFDWQVAHPWSSQHPLNDKHGTRGWVQGAFLTGVMEAYRATNDAAYLDYARATAKANGWQLGPREEHADDHIVGQTYLELHQIAPASGQLDSTRAILDKLVANPKPGREIWWWCDALYMSPPTLAKFSQITKDPRYIATMDRLYWDTHAAFYDRDERLFYRDKRYLASADGKKVFWSRGNGWILAGLARLLDVLPADHPSRVRYVGLYREMATRLVDLQPADGLWRSNLLHPENQHGEASGSAFFCYALAWGLNRGILRDPASRAAVDRSWTALLACVDADGRLGWVQPIGFAPGAYDATTWQEYGAGAFLAAGSQVMQLR